LTALVYVGLYVHGVVVFVATTAAEESYALTARKGGKLSIFFFV